MIYPRWWVETHLTQGWLTRGRVGENPLYDGVA
jgi:hypothetical protein